VQTEAILSGTGCVHRALLAHCATGMHCISSGVCWHLQATWEYQKNDKFAIYPFDNAITGYIRRHKWYMN
jgi:hypothetical protein